MTISDAIRYVGVNDTDIDLFESQYPVPNGVSYNSYLLLDDKIALLDTVDKRKYDDWATKVDAVLDGRTPDYIVVHHLEPDHAGSLQMTIEKYPEATLVLSAKALAMLPQFFDLPAGTKTLSVKEGDTLELGHHTLTFVMAPMVHWPEVIVTYDSTDKVLFSADGFGKFGALDVEEDWADEARRYYIGIVGKYGAQVQALLKKAAALDIAIICPLHGPVLNENLGYYLDKYNTWSSYAVEDEGVVIAYTSVYGHTKEAVEELAEKLNQRGCPNVVVADLARCDMAEAVADAFRYSKLVLATTTYNATIFPHMQSFIDHLTARNYQGRTVGMIENGAWAPMAAKVMKKMLETSKNLTYTDTTVTVKCALNDASRAQIDALADELCK